MTDSTQPAHLRPKRIHSLDALRGLAALAVVFWHWQHFFYVGEKLPPGFDRTSQPFFFPFRLFYERGWLAVILFFSLSGFIFFWLYARAISEHRTSATRFFILRFSRLYPLHFITFLLMAVGQVAWAGIHGGWFVYQLQDARHFLLNLFLLQSSGLEAGYSYNAPSWSISVEAILYALFFSLCWIRKLHPGALALISALGFFAVSFAYQPIGQGMGSFFLGGCLYHLFHAVTQTKYREVITWTTITATIFLWLGTVVCYYAGPSFHEMPLLKPIGSAGIRSLTVLYPAIILFPATILSLALAETLRGDLGRQLSFLGDISYSTYLWHFPLQLVFALANSSYGGSAGFFTKQLSFLLYFGTLIILSLASYHFFEMPVQNYLRGRWLPARPTTHRMPAP